MMNIGVYCPDYIPESFRVCVDNIGRELEALGVTLKRFASGDDLPTDVDCFWDPRSGGGNPPADFVLRTTQPCVVTVHGVAPMDIPFEYASGLLGHAEVLYDNWVNRRAWSRYGGHYAAVVAVSNFGKRNIASHLKVDSQSIFVCLNGVNHDVFRPKGAVPAETYLFHLSNDEPRKNVERIIAAWRRLDLPHKPELWLKLPPGTGRAAAPGLRIIERRLEDEEIADLYSGAQAFLFPSLYEGFGLPILEAMACGCPVITADATACGEVAGGAALLVDPRSVPDIAAGLARLIGDSALRRSLRDLGLARAAGFTWKKSAAAYLTVFRRVCGDGRYESDRGHDATVSERQMGGA